MARMTYPQYIASDKGAAAIATAKADEHRNIADLVYTHGRVAVVNMAAAILDDLHAHVAAAARLRIPAEEARYAARATAWDEFLSLSALMGVTPRP